MKSALIGIILALSVTTTASAQSITEAFQPAADSLASLLEERTGVRNELKYKKILKRKSSLDFYFTSSLAAYPWHSDEDVRWFKKTLRSLFPEEYRGYQLGVIFSEKVSITSLYTPTIGNDGSRRPYRYAQSNPAPHALVSGGMEYPKGLSGRNIVVWQSHGRYFNESRGRWMWQRAPLHTTVEDVFTQDYVLPFLIPMLERAGAYVMTPRERDPQPQEYVIDNDPSFEGERSGLMRRVGFYEESGKWEDAGEGFADTARVYRLYDNVFKAGSAREAVCSKKSSATATWTADILDRGFYSVYVSYASFPASSQAAHYTVRHMGGSSEFEVDQRRGGGTWIYLGTFEFDRGTKAVVTLDNVSPKGKNASVSADAVRIGGGMGKVERCGADSVWSTSGLPAYLEGALYSEQWAGTDSCVIGQWEGDYTCDYASRGAWVEMLHRDKKIPVDLSLAIHTDAGTMGADSTVGTLAIYSYDNKGEFTLSDGRSRMVSRSYAEMVEDQLCGDIRSLWDKDWGDRGLRDASYSESRSTDTPALLLEMLSHQNFADMRLGLDPAFRFDVCRAIYKGMLKYLSTLYGVPYAVAPLPVRNFSVCFDDGGDALLSWSDTPDPLEPTANAQRYILYTRRGEGAFDSGRLLEGVRRDGGVVSCSVPLTPGELYSFRLEAVGEGGRSFPSEVLCIGRPDSTAVANVLIVNNFDRVAGPSWVDADPWTGFCGEKGMPWGRSLSYAGDVYEFRRFRGWTSDEDPGWGASSTSSVGSVVSGNTFDFVSIHARTLLSEGAAVHSASRDAFCERGFGGCCCDSLPKVIDLLCGNQLSTPLYAKDSVRYRVFPAALREAVTMEARSGTNLIVSGSYIATDCCDSLYPGVCDSLYSALATAFASGILGFKRQGPRASEAYASSLYGAPWPDALASVNFKPAYMYYPDTHLPASVSYDGGVYRSVSFGFPLEMDPSRLAEAFRYLLYLQE